MSALVGLEELELRFCDLNALPAGTGRLAGLKMLDLSYNRALTALPAELGRLRNLKVLVLGGCPGLAAPENLQRCKGLPAVLAHLSRRGSS
jgi:hypothetical protein